MRSPNKRSRSKSNRQKPLGNIVNRVFDSSGPAGKVRGTPQQIIDKYLAQARDAQLSGDRVASENFAQHAEHYARMLSEAQAEIAREAEARREQQQQQHDRQQQDRQQQDRQQQGGQQQGGQGDARGDDHHNAGQQGRRRNAPHGDGEQPNRDQAPGGAEAGQAGADVLDSPSDEAGETGLVETPEGTGAGSAAHDAPGAGEGQNDGQNVGQGDGQGGADAKPAPRNRRRAPRKPAEGEAAKPRSPRKPRAKQGDAAQPGDNPTHSAAE